MDSAKQSHGPGRQQRQSVWADQKRDQQPGKTAPQTCSEKDPYGYQKDDSRQNAEDGPGRKDKEFAKNIENPGDYQKRQR